MRNSLQIEGRYDISWEQRIEAMVIGILFNLIDAAQDWR